MDVNNIMAKLSNNIDKIGIAAGALSFGLDSILLNVQALAAGKGHIPDVGYMVKQFFATGAGEKTNAGIMALIAGVVLDEVGISQGKLVKKFAVGFLEGHFAQHVLYFSTHSEGGSFGSGGGGNYGSTGNRGYGY